MFLKRTNQVLFFVIKYIMYNINIYVHVKTWVVTYIYYIIQVQKYIEFSKIEE